MYILLFLHRKVDIRSYVFLSFMRNVKLDQISINKILQSVLQSEFKLIREEECWDFKENFKFVGFVKKWDWNPSPTYVMPFHQAHSPIKILRFFRIVSKVTLERQGNPSMVTSQHLSIKQLCRLWSIFLCNRKLVSTMQPI